MLKRVKQYAYPVITCVLTLVAALFWVALRVNYSGISKFLGADTNPSFLVMNLPLMVCALAWVGFVLSLIGLFRWGRGRRWPTVTAFVIGVIMVVGGAVVVFFGAWDYLRFILVHFRRSLLVAAGLVVLALLLFFPWKAKTRKALALKALVLCVAVAGAVIAGYALRGNDFRGGAVVYAVEDTYQIVFATTDNALGWVEIGGQRYYDLYAGSMRSADRVHKVEVPQSVLDAAGSYTVCAQQMIYRGPFGGYKGKVISHSYSFRPVDSSDGLRYYTMSDVHEAIGPAVAAATSQGELDFLVLMGDMISMVETEEDALFANEVAYAVTRGEYPVIYTRGNHEIKGEWAEQLYKYVGSKNQSFYYTVTLGGGDVFGVVLDLGEDHGDDWWEYYGTAQFDLYRQEQSDFLRRILEEQPYEGSRYRMVMCHIPIVFVDKNRYYESFRLEWTNLLNRMDMDQYVGGHKHVLYPFVVGAVEPNTRLTYNPAYSGVEGKTYNGYYTDFNFAGFLVGRRSDAPLGGTEQFGMSQYTGLLTEVSFAAGTQTSRFTNSMGETLAVVNPFGTGPAQQEFTSLLKNVG